jgi:hypothetical protein
MSKTLTDRRKSDAWNVLAAWLSFVCSLVLEQVALVWMELKRLAYLAMPAIGRGR